MESAIKFRCGKCQGDCVIKYDPIVYIEPEYCPFCKSEDVTKVIDE